MISTDGVSEARDVESEFFGEERLLETVSGKSAIAAATVTADVLDAVRQFADGAEQSDDITIMTLRYTPTAG